MALAHQLGEEDTDDIVKLLDEWDKDKVGHHHHHMSLMAGVE